MRKLNRWAVTVAALALGMVAGAWAQEKSNAERAFERFHSLFEPGVQTQPMSSEQDRPAKQRRIIVNDAGEVEIPIDGSWEEYLAQRWTDIVGTQVDSYFLCIASDDRAAGIRRTLQSAMAYWASDEETPAYYHDATHRYLEAAHEAGVEIFAALRMNDMHDAMSPELTYPLKVQRPDLLLGDRETHGGTRGDTLMSAYWVAMGYAQEEVRQHWLDFIAVYCRQYDYDGIELDFCLGQVLFKLGEEDQNIETLTQFVRQVRQTLNEIGRERGRPYLLTVRALSTPDQSLRAGLDVEQWLAEGLVDLLMVGGGVIPYSPQLKQFIDMAHRYGVPAYPCMNRFGGGVAAGKPIRSFARKRRLTLQRTDLKGETFNGPPLAGERIARVPAGYKHRVDAVEDSAVAAAAMYTDQHRLTACHYYPIVRSHSCQPPQSLAGHTSAAAPGCA